MLKAFGLVFALAGAAAAPINLPAGRWDVTSKVVEFAVPGVPGFMASLIRGKSRAEHKRLKAGEGIEALLAPDPKANCRIGSQRIADGRYSQEIACPQKKGGPLQIVRSGTYDATGFVGRATVSGTSPKGPLRIVLSQRAVRIGG